MVAPLPLVLKNQQTCMWETIEIWGSEVVHPRVFGDDIDKCIRINGRILMSAISCLFLPVIPIDKGVLASRCASIDHL